MAALIAFYSRADENYFGGDLRYIKVGNTQRAAEMIQEAVGGELFQIRQQEPYSADYRTCVESSYVVGKLRGEDVQGDCCCFAVDTGNEDVASAMFLCEDGAIISYNQNFTVKRTAARRGCRIIGTKGSAEFDFYTGVIRHDDYAFDQTATIRIRPTGGNHFGGDRRLAQDFMNLLAGGTPSSDLLGGLRSAACCLAAKRSAETNCLTDILL